MVEGFSRVAGLHFLPEDRGAVDRSLVSGRPLAEVGESSLVHSLTALADATFPSTVRTTPHRRARRGLRHRVR